MGEPPAWGRSCDQSQEETKLLPHIENKRCPPGPRGSLWAVPPYFLSYERESKNHCEKERGRAIEDLDPRGAEEGVTEWRNPESWGHAEGRGHRMPMEEVTSVNHRTGS